MLKLASASRFGLLVALLTQACSSSEAGVSALAGPDAEAPDAAVTADGAPDASDEPTSDASDEPDAGPVEGPPPAGVTLTLPIAATAACAPTDAACDAQPADVAAGGYRKDFFYPLSRYPEASIPDPVDGGRMHLVATAHASGRVTGVWLDGSTSDALLDAGSLDWLHVWPTQVTAGAPVWVAFHSRSASFDARASLDLVVATDAGPAVETTVPYARAAVLLTYVAHDDARTTAIVHLHNRDAAPHTLTRLVVDGRDVTASACAAHPTLGPGEATVVTVPLCASTRTGAPWSVVAEWADAPPSVAGGRVAPLHFPIETWPVESECPLPGGRDALFDEHRSAGFDTFFLRGSYSDPACHGLTSDTVIASARTRGFDVFPDEFLPLASGLGEADGVVARLLADEADASVTDGSARRLAETAQALWESNPTAAAYVGGSRHRHGGTFAGVADLQGMDFYVAACAPHVTDFGAHPPLRGAYDYLHATRENQLPLPTWLYSQGLAAGWNRGSGASLVVRQPDPTELSIQAWSVVAAGGKGLMYFQTDMGLALGAARPTWDAIAAVNHAVHALAPRLREGDPTVTVRASNDDVIVTGVRARDAVLVVAIDVRSSAGFDDARCLFEPSPHWRVDANTPHVTVAWPPELALADAFEVQGGAVVAAPPATRAGREVTFPYLALDAERPVRVLVLASSSAARAEIAAALAAK